jgi:hypothetical protein
LIKILEVHSQLKVDAEAVAKAWPASKGDPTPRALRERLVKIRELARSAGHLPMRGSGTANGVSSASITDSPRAPRTPGGRATTRGSGDGGSSTKRKRNGTNTQDGKGLNHGDDNEDILPIQGCDTSEEEQDVNDTLNGHERIKQEHEEILISDDSDEMDLTPSKKKPKLEKSSAFLENPETEAEVEPTGWMDDYLK